MSCAQTDDKMVTLSAGIVFLVLIVINSQCASGQRQASRTFMDTAGISGFSQSKTNKFRRKEQENGNEGVCDDVAIIGGGPSGSYAAWRLRNKGLKISLYEYSDRIGGRLHTVQLPGIPDINCELGAMRFIPASHPKITALISQLGLRSVDFPLGVGTRPDTMYYLRNTHMRYAELPTHAPYHLPPHHRIDFKTLKFEIFDNFTRESVFKQNSSDPHSAQFIESLDGVPLYKQSHNVFSAKYLDIETNNYLRDASSFSDYYEHEAQATDSVPSGDPNADPPVVQTVATGFQSIPVTMVNQFIAASLRHNLFLNHHLRSVRKERTGEYRLRFTQTETVKGKTTDSKTLPPVGRCARKVMLAIPRIALEHLDWNVLKRPDIRNIIRFAIEDVKAGKMYFGYRSPWWRRYPNYSDYTVSDTPLRQTYDFGQSDIGNRAVLNTAYSDHSNEMWKEMVATGGADYPGTADESLSMSYLAVDIARKYYANILDIPVHDVPRPAFAVMRIWDQYPIGASWYVWRPNYRQDLVAKRMLKPSAADDVYIISNTFSLGESSGWVEGALDKVDEMILDCQL